VAKKKDTKSIQRRRAKSKQETQKKRHLKLVKEKLKKEAGFHFHPTPPVADMEAPSGFRAVSMAQALIEYYKPLEQDAGDDLKSRNEVLGISSAIWNYEISQTEGAAEKELEELRKTIITNIKAVFSMKDGEANELLRDMIQRKRHLFPEDIQPKHFRTMMFMRKELSHLIAPFNYVGLSYRAEPIPPDRRDQSAIHKIKRMDQYIIDGAEYDEWEDFYFSMEEEVRGRYEKWLNEKGLTEFAQIFGSNLDMFLNFIYRYVHGAPAILKSVAPERFEEFLFDHLLRKLVAEPHEYVLFPPTLKLFYEFLLEKGYIAELESKDIIETIDGMEPEFIDVLREQFG